jgi:hypothetical protein
MISSASSTAAAASLAAHGHASPTQAGMATIATSIISPMMNLPILRKELSGKPIFRELAAATCLQVLIGALSATLQYRFLRF